MGSGEEQRNGAPGTVENGEGSEDGRDTLEDLTRGRPDMVAVLERPEIRKNPGEWVYQEGEEIRRFFYVLRGKVNIIAAGEVIGTVESGGLLGVHEFLLRDESDNPRYSQSAQVVEPTLVLGLDENGFEVLVDPQEGALKAYLRLQAKVTKKLEEIVVKRNIENSKLQATLARMSVALRVTQDDLAAKEKLAKFPPRPKAAPPPLPHSPYPDLRKKLQEVRITNQALAKLLETRDEELARFLEEFRQILNQYPDLLKNRAVEVLFRKIEQAVIRRANTLVNIK